MIIGLVGKNGSGKGEVARFLTEAGFNYHSLSDVLREELRKAGKPVTRKNLTDYANDLRARYGAGALGEKVAAKLEPDRQYVVDSIRHPMEVEALKKCPDFYLLAVEADPEIRFERIKNRKRETDPVTYDEFLAQEVKEAKGEKDSDQQINKTLTLADAKIENVGNLDELHRKVREVLQALALDSKRPDWDEYFMNIAQQVSLRSNCIKRKVAALIVKDHRIISTGYNGTPRGIKNCNEGGCPRCHNFGTSGESLEACLCSHAEENSIVQAAYHGVNVQGSTLYTTLAPCLLCAKMIINSGIREIVYNHSYVVEELALRLLKESKLKIRQYSNGKE